MHILITALFYGVVFTVSFCLSRTLQRTLNNHDKAKRIHAYYLMNATRKRIGEPILSPSHFGLYACDLPDGEISCSKQDS